MLMKPGTLQDNNTQPREKGCAASPPPFCCPCLCGPDFRTKAQICKLLFATINQRLVLISGRQHEQAPALAAERWQPRAGPAREDNLLGRGGSKQLEEKQLWEVNLEEGTVPTQPGEPRAPASGRVAGEEAVISTSICNQEAGSAIAGKCSPRSPVLIRRRRRHPALPRSPHHGTRPWAHREEAFSHQQHLPWLLVATHCQGSCRNPQPVGLQEVFPASNLPS